MPKNEELLATAGDWFYVSCHVIVNLGSGVTVTSEGGLCALCGNNNMRFMHTLGHWGTDGDPDGREIQVGIDCASMLLSANEGYLPRVAENETKRKEKWRIIHRNPGRCVTTEDDLIEKGKL